jgi:hypothetical protein
LGGLATFVAAQAAEDCTEQNLAPWGFAATGNTPHAPNSVTNPHCINKYGDQQQNGCFVTFKGYQWWTTFNYVGQYYNNSFYYNGGLFTPFAPEHAYVDSDGLHLLINNDVWLGDPNNPPNTFPFTGGEVVLMKDSSGNIVSLTYGDYLVTAKPVSSINFQTLDVNVALGMFTYERFGPPPNGAANCDGNCGNFPWPTFGPSANPSREIDLAEISRWGWDQTTANCPFNNRTPVNQFNLSVLCKGNAQFATQDFSQKADSVQRYDIGSNQEVTLVMRLKKDSVEFLKFNGGGIHLDKLPNTPATSWSSPDPLKIPQGDQFKVSVPGGLKNFIPVLNQANDKNSPTTCAQFHINFWLGNNIPNLNSGQSNPHPPPTLKQHIIITNFQYNPLAGPQNAKKR